MKKLQIDDGSLWPDPTSCDYRDLAWRLRYAQGSITSSDMYNAADIMSAYSDLILHPAFSLNRVQQKISGIRKAMEGKGNN